MISARISPRATRNGRVVAQPRERRREGNLAWIGRALAQGDPNQAAVLLLGGSNPMDFRHRTAQAHVRSDMLPSFWSDAALVLPLDASAIGASGTGFEVFTAGALVSEPLHTLPGRNAIGGLSLRALDSAVRFPNIAVLRFAGAGSAEVRSAVELLKRSRLVEDLVTPTVRWLGYALGAQDAPNPLQAATPLPSALLVETALGHLQIDALPGLDQRASCPEALWQAVLWWGEYYQGALESGEPPSGAYVIDQPAASITVE